MIRRSFNAEWTAGFKRGKFDAFIKAADAEPVGPPVDVVLPHDAVRDLTRSGSHEAHTGYFPGGHFLYAKTFEVPEEYRDKVVVLEFEGIYRDAVVYLNGERAANRPNGYSTITVPADAFLKFGEPNLIEIECRSHEDTRWYTGSGIYRDTWIAVADPVHLPLGAVRVKTEHIEHDRATISVATTVRNDTRQTRTVRVDTSVTGPDGAVVATGTAPITLLPHTAGVSRVRLLVDTPQLWSPDSPALHTVDTTLRDGDTVLDTDRSAFGIRTVQVDPRAGLRINGRTTDLRGACIHHDNGPLGAAAVTRAEHRRVELLKAAGFNAIRSSHNQLSRATLEACDRVGVLVMDELSDVWTEPKTGFDYSLDFAQWWERDVEAMIAKDYNHPSVILYSIGNEIFETGTPIGSTWGRLLAEKIRTLDDTRLVTNAINAMLSVFEQVLPMMTAAAEAAAAEAQQPAPGAGQDFNSAMDALGGDALGQLVASELVTAAIEESAAQLDVLGLNYGDARYELDAELFPNRVIVGSETNPSHIDELWRLVTELPHVIGDFTWTGWDYLGESGIGRVEYTDTPGFVDSGLTARYPYLTASTGDLDITGHRRPISYYRETVFGLRTAPYIAVHRPEFYGRPMKSSGWSWSDSVSSWTWDAAAGSPVIVDVYSDADEIELVVNGDVVAREGVGKEKPFLARFDTSYQPGEIVAVAYRGGDETSRTSLRSATGPVLLAAHPDRDTISAGDTDLAYVDIVLQDADGNLHNAADCPVTVTVTGPGQLAGLGSGRPSTEEAFGAPTCTTYDGRALAIVRPTGSGEMVVTVAAEGLETVSVRVISAD